MWVKKDRETFKERSKEIIDALAGKTGMINGVNERNREKIFYELCFCLCVPQSRAALAEKAIKSLRDADLYSKELTEQQIVGHIKGLVRFQNTKANRLFLARERFPILWKLLKRNYIEFCHCRDKERVLQGSRLHLVSFVKGMGMKLASQFLRNVGMRGLAILDVHILDHLKERGLIQPTSALTKKQYCDIEGVMRDYAKTVGITLDELDLLWWSNKTGFVLR